MISHTREIPRPIPWIGLSRIRSERIPRDLPEGLIAGLKWDAVGRRYNNIADLAQAYAVRVGRTVGAMMAMLMHASSPEHVARHLGIAMQLTNIRSRCWGGRARGARTSIVAARSITAQLLYAEIGNELRRRSCNSVSRRTTVSTARKLELCGASFSALIPAFGEISDGCIHEAQFVIDAMTPTHGAKVNAVVPSWWDFYGQALRLLEIFEKIERRELSATDTGAQGRGIA